MVYRFQDGIALAARFRRIAARLAAPGHCLFCDAASPADVDICEACQSDLPWLEPGCRVCAQPLEPAESSDLCGRCLAQPPHFSHTQACWAYRPPLSRAIARYKYHRALSTGRSLTLLMASQIASTYSHTGYPDLITHVPLHWTRYLRRGFNQSEAIAGLLARRLRLPHRPLLRRNRATPPQQSLDAGQRQSNLRGAFSCRESLGGATVALVDDVITTGATADEISRVLLRAGAGEVHIWCLAKTPQ